MAFYFVTVNLRDRYYQTEFENQALKRKSPKWKKSVEEGEEGEEEFERWGDGGKEEEEEAFDETKAVEVEAGYGGERWVNFPLGELEESEIDDAVQQAKEDLSAFYDVPMEDIYADNVYRKPEGGGPLEDMNWSPF